MNQVQVIGRTDKQRELLHDSLRVRRMDPSLHYLSNQQVRKWLIVHKKYSPVVGSSDAFHVYKKAFAHIAHDLDAPSVQVISLGCGGGNKDVLLLQQLRKFKKRTEYLPCDISEALAQKAARRAGPFVQASHCMPIVCNLTAAADLAVWLKSNRRKFSTSVQRIVLFLGILPNMEPQKASDCLRGLLQSGDLFVVSANMAPGPAYHKNMRKILSQYDNPETRSWLFVLFDELGISRDAGNLHFMIRHPLHPEGLYKIEAIFRFNRSVRIMVDGSIYHFRKNKELRLFFSNRYTTTLVEKFLTQCSAGDIRVWINSLGDEGVAMARMR